MIRQSFGLQVMSAFTLGLNFLFVVMSTRQLDADSFGTLYAAISLISTMYAPSVALNFVLTRHFFEVNESRDLQHAAAAAYGTIKAFALWGAALAAISTIVMAAAASVFPIQSLWLLILIAATVYSGYLADIARAYFQGLHRFGALTGYNAVWMTGRFVFCLAGLVITGRPWGALAGMMASSVAMVVWFWWKLEGGGTGVPNPPWPKFRQTIPFACGYGLFASLLNLDVLLAYVSMDHEMSGRYSATTLFPKAIVIFSMPLVQVAFAAFLRHRNRITAFVDNISTAVLLTAGMAAAGAMVGHLALVLGICGENGIVKTCSADQGVILVWTAIPLCLIRMLVVAPLARGHHWQPFFLLPAILAFSGYWLGTSPPAHTLAWQFSIYCWGVLAIYAPLVLIPLHRAHKLVT